MLVAYGLAPLAVLAWCWVYTRASDADVARLLVQLAAGGALAAAPLVAYHAYHGSLRIWLDDT